MYNYKLNLISFGLMNESLIKSFLGIDELQTPIIKILLEKLVDYTTEEDM